MPGANYAEVQAYGNLEQLYDEDLTYQENIKNSFFNKIRKAGKSDVEFDGAAWNVGVTFVLNESYAAINDGERLPDPDYQKGVFAQYNSKLMYSQIEATTYAATRGYKNGRPTGKYLDDLIKGTLLTFNSNNDFDAYGNGRGYRATIATATGAATSFTVTFSTRLRSNMVLDWYDSTLTTKKGSIKISNQGVDHIARTVYIDTTYGTGAVPSTAAANDVLVVARALDPGEPSDGRYMAGYLRLVDNTVALGGLSPSSWALWQAVNINAGLANPNQEILQQVHDQSYIVSGLYPNIGVINPSWKRGYLSGFLGQRRFTTNSFDTGATRLSWSAVKMGQDESKMKPVEMEWIEDKNQNPANVFMYNQSAWMFASDYSDTPHLADEDGAEFRFRIGFDSMQGFIRFWGNTVVKQRNALSIITNFNVASGTV
jgi:hypothetical protein